MKLLSIRFCNFRQFYGKTPEVVLATGEKNTTIIHGNNGSGKTTVLNGFTWVLYEKFTAAFSSPDLLINKRAITEVQTGASVECWVEIQFEHESKRYQLKRKCFVCRDKEGKIQYSKSQFFMLIAGDDGCWYHPLEQPEDIINRILPESLHRYFFFDGEHIDHLFRNTESSAIAEDTKDLIGVKVLDRSLEHLKKAKKSLQDELKDIGESNIKKLIQQHTDLEKNSSIIQNNQEYILQQIEQQEELKKVLSQRLLELSGAEELKQLKEKLEQQEKNLRQNLVKAKSTLKSFLSNQGYIVFLSEIITEFNQLIDDLRARGELPSGIKQQFVQQLLKQKICICGNKLEEGSTAYQQVNNWMNKAGIAEIEEAAIRLEAKVGELTQQSAEFWQKLDKQQANIKQWRSELSQVENELDEIRNKFRHYPNEDIQNLQKCLDELTDSLKELTLEQGANKHQLEVIEKQLASISKQIEKHQIKEQKQTLAQRRIQVNQEAIDRIIEVRKRLENQFRKSLEQRVQEIFNSISFTPYIPRISPNYQLRLMENTSGIAVSVAASTGENQILGLSFIGGIIDRVREWSQKNTLMGLDSSTFPIVMDSPFGSLDEIYRRQVAKSIPQIANQLIILVTKTQWRIEVEEEVADYLGKEYVLVYHSPKQDCEEDSIILHGVNYPLVKQSPNEFEYTEIVEVIST
jgi:DNA sulfur modification protein DndD